MLDGKSLSEFHFLFPSLPRLAACCNSKKNLKRIQDIFIEKLRFLVNHSFQVFYLECILDMLEKRLFCVLAFVEMTTRFIVVLVELERCDLIHTLCDMSAHG